MPLALCSELVTDAELEAAARIEVRSTHSHERAEWAGAGMAVLCRRLLVITPSAETFAASVKWAADAVAENIPVASSMWAGLTSKLHELPAASAAPYALQVRRSRVAVRMADCASLAMCNFLWGVPFLPVSHSLHSFSLSPVRHLPCGEYLFL